MNSGNPEFNKSELAQEVKVQGLGNSEARELRKSGTQELENSGTRELRNSRAQEVESSGNSIAQVSRAQESEKSGTREFMKSRTSLGSREVRNSGTQELGTSGTRVLRELRIVNPPSAVVHGNVNENRERRERCGTLLAEGLQEVPRAVG